MKINTPLVWDHDKKTVTLQLTYEQYDKMMLVDFESQCHLLRINKSLVRKLYQSTRKHAQDANAAVAGSQAQLSQHTYTMAPNPK